MADAKTHEAKDEKLEMKEEDREAARRQEDRAQQEDLNQGMSTGTHDTTRQGVDWGPSYGSSGSENTRSNSEDETSTGKGSKKTTSTDPIPRKP